MAYRRKYVLKERSEEQTLSLELGSLLHKIRELCSQSLMAGQTPDYETLVGFMTDGWVGVDKADSLKPDNTHPTATTLLGVNQLKEKYFSDWIHIEEGIPDYEKRLAAMVSHLHDEEADQDWKPIAVEIPFEVDFGNYTLFGIIDKVEQNRNNPKQLRIVDYKSSKKVYDSDKLITPLQFFFYFLAIQKMYPDCEIVDQVYDFVMFGEQRSAGTKGWLKRAEKKLTTLLERLDECFTTDQWKPKPTPLCFWCDYCKLNPNAGEKYKHNCQFYSLWMPSNKTFEVAKPWSPEAEKTVQKYADFKF